jgi:protein-disulfide isomerase
MADSVRNEDRALTITRRKFLQSASALALLGGLLAAAGESGLALIRPAEADAISPVELMAPGALPDQVMGSAEAPVTIVEYASMTCPHCAHFATTTFPELKKRYIDTGKVKYIFREFPLDRLAVAGSLLARCAGAGDKYFATIELLFTQQDKWVVRDPLPRLMDLAKQAGFTQDTFNACLKNQEMFDKIVKVREDAAAKFKVESTPTFFINGNKVAGALTIDEMAKQIDPLLPKSG